ncbi:MAG: carboxypeptidase regulatory-like domain-containing protein [Opitutales bacterium]|nr:carboxypeptidase regulatory-like domain-containing protein [Opitutales bacterium]
MKERFVSRHCRAVSTALVLCVVVPAAFARDILAEWNFNSITEESVTNGVQEVFKADAGEGTLLVDSGSSVGTNFWQYPGQGTLVNAAPGTVAGGSIAMNRGSRWNNGYVELRADMTDYRDVLVSFAFHYSDTFPSTTTVEWSVDGGSTFTAYKTFDNADFAGDYTRAQLDLSGVPALNNAADARVRLRYSADGGDIGTGTGARYDNFHFSARSAPVTNAPAELVITGQPGDIFVPVHLGQTNAISPAPVVRVLDSTGQPVRWGVEVTASLFPHGFASGATVAATSDIDGYARFDNLLLDTAAPDYRITFSADGVPSVESALFAGVAVPEAEVLVLENQPTNQWTSGDPARIFPAVRMRAELADGTRLPFIEVSAALSPHPFADSSVTTAVTDANGVVRFDQLWLDVAHAGYTITFSSPGEASVTTAAFDLSILDHAPRLFATPERIGRARAGMEQPGSHHAGAVQAMKDRVAGPLSVYRAGNHEDDPNSFFSWRAREAALLYLITDDPDYAQIAFDALQGITSDGIVGSNGLRRAMVSTGFAFAYDWAANGWTQEQRDWVHGEMLRGLDEWPSFSHPNFQHPGGSNWVAVCRGAELTLMLAAGEEGNRSSRFNTLVSALGHHITAGYGSLGYTQEGLGYKVYGGGFLYPAALALEEVLGSTTLSQPLRSRTPWRPFMYNVSFAYSSIDQFRRELPIYLPSGVSNPDFYEEGLTSLFLEFSRNHNDAPYYRHFYDRVTGVESPLAPGFKYDQHRAGTTWAVLFYDPELESEDPTGVWPAAIEDNRGYAWYRNRWQDENDTLGYLFADTNYHGRAWNSEEALAMSLFSNGTLFFHGPSTGTGTPTNFTSIIVDGERPTNNETGQRVSFDATLDDAYIVVGGGAAYQAVGLNHIHRHLFADLGAGRAEGRALFSSLDRFEADQTRTVTWHANLTMPRAHSIDLSLGSEGGRATFLLRGEGDSYLKGWVLHPANASVSDGNGNLAISTEAQQGDIWVAWVTGEGVPPTAEISGSGMESWLEVDGRRIAYDGGADRVTSAPVLPGDDPVAYDEWRIARYGDLDNPDGAPAVDPGGRGYANAAEYALGLDLLQSPYDGLPRAHGKLSISFTRRSESGARLIVERSEDLAPSSWTAVATLEPGTDAWTGLAMVEEDGDGATRSVTVTDPEDISGSESRRFLRVRVELP